MRSSDARAALALAGLVLAGCAGLTGAASPSTVTALPLAHPDGRVRTLGEVLSAHRATVLVFWATQCPCVRRYQERVEALARAFADRDVGFVGVDSNADDSLEDIARVAQSRSVTLPVWQDAGGQVATALGARSTPTVVLLDREGRVKFRGWLDNERLPGESDREPWLEQALEGELSGAPYAAKSPTWGCAITRSLRTIPQCHSPAVEVSASASHPGVAP